MNIVTWALLPLLLVSALGCKSAAKPDYYGDITSDLGSLQSDLNDGALQVDVVTRALNRLGASSGDLRQPLADFSASVANLDEITAQIRNLGKDMQAKEAAYQSSSTKEIKELESADMRRSAEQGRASVAASFQSLDMKGDKLSTLYDEWASTVKFIQSSLEGDLSEANLESLSSKIKGVTNSTPALKESMRMLANELQSVSASMSPRS